MDQTTSPYMPKHCISGTTPTANLCSILRHLLSPGNVNITQNESQQGSLQATHAGRTSFMT